MNKPNDAGAVNILNITRINVSFSLMDVWAKPSSSKNNDKSDCEGFCEKHCQLTYFLTAAKILGRESNFGQDNLATWLFWFACNWNQTVITIRSV